MTIRVRDKKESEPLPQAPVSETLTLLKTAKQSVHALRSDGKKVVDAYNSIALELELSRGHVKSLEEVIKKLKGDLHNAVGKENTNNHDTDAENQKSQDVECLEAEVLALKSEVRTLKSALADADIKHNEERMRYTSHIRSSYQELEQTKSGFIAREAELQAELTKVKSDFEKFKAGLVEGNPNKKEGLSLKLAGGLSNKAESKLESKSKRLKQDVIDLNFFANETEDAATELEAARAAAQEASTELEFVMEQLEEAQSANSELEAELRRVKVQSNQWRKAAELAVSFLSTGRNGKYKDKNISLETVKLGSPPYKSESEEDMLKKENMLKKMGVLWKKPYK